MRDVVDRFITFLESGVAPDNLFTPEVLLDLSVPTWRLQAKGDNNVLRVRLDDHPWPGKVVEHRADPTPTGFVLEWAERWDADGQSWYCREMMRAEVIDGRIAALTVYCTGDWDEARQQQHAREGTR